MGALPQSRFILAMLGILVSEHQSSSLSLLINSGILGLSQTLMRLVGKSVMNVQNLQISFIIITTYIMVKFCLTYISYNSENFLPLEN